MGIYRGPPAIGWKSDHQFAVVGHDRPNWWQQPSRLGPFTQNGGMAHPCDSNNLFDVILYTGMYYPGGCEQVRRPGRP